MFRFPSRQTRNRRTPATIRRRVTSPLLRSEDGGMIVWSIFTVIGILMAVGIGIDVMRVETLRTHMQNTLDRAVLAAADLEQELTAEEVVADYFERSDIPGDAVKLTPTVSKTEKIIGAEISATMGTLLIDLIGRDTLPARARGQAIEALTDIEISLVLDNSGSMGWDGDRRLKLLKPAAKEFIDTVMKPGPLGEASTVSISIVPFSTQVNAGPVLASALSYSAEHSNSHCVEFANDSYTTVALDPTTELRRGGHFDVFTWQVPVGSRNVVCPTETNRHILPFSKDPDALKAHIDSMWAGGNTSIDIAAKWGAALLDPAFRPAVDQLILDEKIDSNVSGRPYDYGRANTMKVLVVMSDGQNTQEYQLRDAYRSGASTVWRDPGSGIVSYFDSGRGEYFALDSADVTAQPSGSWQSQPAGGAAAENLDWPEVWQRWPVAVFARDIKGEAVGGDWRTHYNAVFKSTDANNKNTRAEEICAAARDAKIIVYTVGMDTYGQGDATLANCVGEATTHFYDVNADQIDQAFSSIASQINKLRLTQ